MGKYGCLVISNFGCSISDLGLWVNRGILNVRISKCAYVRIIFLLLNALRLAPCALLIAWVFMGVLKNAGARLCLVINYF